jgi:hypothetical protein
VEIDSYEAIAGRAYSTPGPSDTDSERDTGPVVNGGAAMSQQELLTTQFYDWEKRGRGWLLHPFPVELEPPFVPFKYHWVPPRDPGTDDGRRPTLVSRITEGIGQLVTGKRRPTVSWDFDDLEPETPEVEVDDDDSPIVELKLSVPPPLKVSREAVEQFLASLPIAAGPLSFEVVGLPDSIMVHLAVRETDAAKVSQQLKGYFPEVVLTQENDFLRSAWEASPNGAAILIDFGLSHEFMLPLRTFKGFEIDPLIGVVSAHSDLERGEVAVVQVLFQAVRHPWAKNMMRAVLDHEGKAFFEDAPEIAAAAKAKIAHPLLAAVVRIGVKSPDLSRAWEIARSVGGSLRSFANPAGNEFMPLANDGYDEAEHESDLLLRKSHRSGMILSTEELVSLVHPPSASVRVEKLKREERKTRPAPAIATGQGLLLGVNVHAGKTAQVALTADQRSRHMYVIGASGTGKSTLLLNLILQDLKTGQGVAVLDPHGDLIDQILERVPEERIDDVILLDPADAEYPVGFNILSAHSELEKTLLSSDLASVFRRLSTSWGDQMTSVLGNAILAFLESDRGGTLIDLRRFLVEKSFRDEFLATVRDPDVVYYWRKEFPLLRGSPQASILTRLDTFLRPKLIRYMVAQKDDRLDFRRMMDEGKILLARLSQGAIGEENAHLLGSLLVSKLQQIAMSRQEVAEAERRPFYVYIDEFQNFITPTMEQILSGARKYRLGLILAHQDLRQIGGKSPEVLSSVLSNPFTRICFRVGDQDARTLESGFASYEAKDLQNLGTGQAIARVERAEFDFNLDTPRLAEIDPDEARARRELVITRSREKYGMPREEIEAILQRSVTGRAPARPVEPAPQEVTIPEPLPPAPATIRAERSKRAEPPPAPPSTVPTPGRGGQQHKYMQELIKRWAESREWRATIEEKILDGLGSVDVALRKGDQSVACEIAVTTTSDHEVGNVQKCIAAGFGHVLVVSSEKKTLNQVRQQAGSTFDEEQLRRIHFCTPEEAFAVLEGIEAEAASTTGTVRGYKVKTKYKSVSEQEKTAKREAVSQVIAKAMKRLKPDKK